MFHAYNLIDAFYVGHNLSLFITGVIIIIIHESRSFVLYMFKLLDIKSNHPF